MPFIYNLYLSFTDYQIGTVGTPPWIGIENYTEIFTDDKLFGKSMYNTLVLSWVTACRLRLIFAFLIALVLNLRVRGMELYRTLFYVPSVVPLVAATVIFAGFLNTRYGFLNQFLVLIGAAPVRWLSSPDAIKAIADPAQPLGLWRADDHFPRRLAGHPGRSLRGGRD